MKDEGHKSFITFNRRPSPLVLERIVKSLTVHIPGILELYSVVGLVGGNALKDMAISLDLVLLYLVLIKEPF